MSYQRTVELDRIDQTKPQHEIPFNGLVDAAHIAAAFAVDQFRTQGLALTLIGGMLPAVGGALVFVPTQTIALTASATNYIYVSGAGVVNLATVAPAWWPTGVGGAMALYELTVGADEITSGTNYLTGSGFTGGIGATGAQGPAGADISLQRKVFTVAGNLYESIGQDVTTVASISDNQALATTTLFDTIYSGRLVSNNSAGASAQIHGVRNRWWRGNAAGLGGFDFTLRFGFDSTYAPNVARSFFGIIDVGQCPLGNADPNGLLNLIGVGAVSGDTNLSWLHNDGTGTATMTTLGANFPTNGSINTFYELRLSCDPNGSDIAATITRPDTGSVATTTFSSDIPTNTQFLGLCAWVNNAASSSRCGLHFMQDCNLSRY